MQGLWTLKFEAPAPLTDLLESLQSIAPEVNIERGELLMPNHSVPADRIAFSIATNPVMRGRISEAAAYHMEPVRLHALLLVFCNRLHPVAGLIIGLLDYSNALPEYRMRITPGPCPRDPIRTVERAI